MAIATVVVPRRGLADKTERLSWRRPRRSAAGRGILVVACAAVAVVAPWGLPIWQRDDVVAAGGKLGHTIAPAFFTFDEKDGRFCGKEGDMCKCYGRVRYGRLFTWSDEVISDGSLNCSAATFGDPVPLERVKICKCYPTICTTDMGICTPEPCECPSSRRGDFEWGKKTMMTSDGTKCWACEKRVLTAGTAVDDESPFCPRQIGRCSLNRHCTCKDERDTRRLMKTKDGKKCWKCAVQSEGRLMEMDGSQKAMFWMLPLLWPFVDFPDSMVEVFHGCRALMTFLGLCMVGYVCQTWLTCLRLDRFFSFYAPCMKKGELWRLFTYFMLHSDLQHLCVNIFHLLDALDLEGVPAGMEVSPGVPLRCTRDGPVASICYPDLGIGRAHTIGVVALVLAYGALVGTVKNFGALVQGASSVCFGVDGALIALYAMFLGAGLDSQLKIAEFSTFFWMRIGIIAFHIVLDLVQSLFGSGKDTVGTLAHMSSLIAGFCYVILVLPPMGDGSLFDSTHPYIVNCGLTSPKYVTTEEATNECIAFFSRASGMQVSTAKSVASVILGGGVLMSMVNAVMKRHISADGIACCSSDDAVAEGGVAGISVAGPPARSGASWKQPDMMSTIAEHSQQIRAELEKMERLYAAIPDPATLPAPRAT